MRKLSSGLAVVIAAILYFIGSSLNGVEAKQTERIINDKFVHVERKVTTLEVKEISTKKKEVRQKIKQIKQKERKEVKKIFIGDSRFVGMEAYTSTGDNEEYIAKISQGYNYLSKEAMILAESKITDKYDYKIIIGLGVNDLGNIDKYIDFYNNLDIKAEIYIVSVNPIDYHKTISNDNISEFNNRVKNEVSGIKFIDTYSFLMKTGYGTDDGLHYNTSTYKKIKDYIDKEIS